MITKANYFEATRNVDFSKLPDALKNGDKLTRGASQNNWSAYNSNESIKRVVDAYLQKLDEWIEKNQPEEKTEPEKKEAAKPKAEKKPRVKKEKPVKEKEEEPEPEKTETATPVEKLTTEIAFIKRYIGLNGKEKDQHQILNFINSLQKAIVEKRIRKTSPYAKEIEHIQDQLIICYEQMGNSVLLKIDEKTFDEYTAIAYSEKTMLSVSYIKQYISIHGKLGVKARVKALLEKIKKAVESGKIQKSDPHYNELQDVLKSLNNFIEGKTKVPEVNASVLNGLMGIAGCGSKKKAHSEDEEELGEVETEVADSPRIISSIELSGMDFQTIGLQGKYRELMGDPAVGFSAMVYGLPKSGKSTLCIDFAKHLAEHHGKVLYVAIEEGFGYTLKEKFERMGAIHPNLEISETLPDDLSPYQFVFIDSVSKAGLSADNLTELREKYPQTAFIYVFQTTKEGNFRGRQDFAHDVDVIISVEKGIANANGRFGVGGIFNMFN